MRPPSKFEIMRRNQRWRMQPAVVDAAPVVTVIDDVETEVDREWAEHRRQLEVQRREEFEDTVDWLRDTKRQTRSCPKVQERERTRRRRWWQFWKRK